MNFKEIFELTKKIDSLQSGDTIEIEKIKLKIEWYKAWGTVLSIFIPLCTGAAAFMGGIWLEHERANTAFQIKAIEIAMTAAKPGIATKKAIVMSELIPDRVPKDFGEKMKTLYPD